MRTAIVCLTALLASLSAGPARAESVLFVHTGDTDPEDEGWFYWRLTSDPEVEAVPDDDGVAAWSVRDDGGTAAAVYREDVSEEQVASAAALGWRLSCRVRVVQIPQAHVGGTWVGYRTGTRSFQLHINSTESGSAFVGVPDEGAGTTLTAEIEGSGYHLYELRYDPSSETATLSVDGTDRITDLVGGALDGDSYVAWGDGEADQNHQPSHAHFNFVEFVIDPQRPPAMVTTSADTYLRQGDPNQNFGAQTYLRLQASGKNRALVQFDEGAIEEAVGSATVATARLRVHIDLNQNNWGTAGRTVSAHRMLTAWTESGATWNSPDDQDPSNSKVDGDSWTMGGSTPDARPFDPDPTDSFVHFDGLTGWVEWDVTADVQAFLSGGATNYGWLIKKDDEGAEGKVEYSSSEGDSPPELVIEFE